MSRLIAVVQARAGSTRLPRKVLRDLGGRPVLAWVVGAAQNSGVCEEVVVATTTDAADDEVASLAAGLGARVVRGPVDDVLSRFLLAADAVDARPGAGIVRLTSDCPLLDPSVVAMCASAFVPRRVDYVTTDHEHTVAHGFDVEVVSVDALRRLDSVATGADRSHVTSYIASHPGEFRIASVAFDPPCTDLRVTLDEPADAALLDAIVAELGDDATNWRAVVALLRARPDLVALNAHVGIKPIAAG
jgi:spore coat polysaccharide biosynthesis protein SpsF